MAHTCVYTKAPTTSIQKLKAKIPLNGIFAFNFKKIVVTHKFFNLFHKSTDIHCGLKAGTTF